MVFATINNDYSGKIIVDTYDVNRIDIYTEWEDANGTKHRDVYRQRIQGSFDMQISKISEYQAFVDDIRTHKTNGGFVACRVCVNNENNENVYAELFIDYAPIKTMKNDYTKGYLTFTVNIEER